MRGHNYVVTVAGVKSGDLSASFNSDPIPLEQYTYYSLSFTVSAATGLTGSWKLQYTNDHGFDPGAGGKNVTGLSNWIDVANSTEAITSNGTTAANYAGAGYFWLRVVWTATGGTGAALMQVTLKGAE